MNLWGKKKAPPPPKANPIDTINTLKAHSDILEKREQLLRAKIDVQLKDAKQRALIKDKNGAMLALKRKQMYEDEIKKLMGTRVTLEQQIIGLESASINIGTVKVMQQGNEGLKAVRGTVDADEIDNLMDDLAEEKDLHDQISEAISGPGQAMLEDEDLLAELAELEAGEIGAPVATPSVPDTIFTSIPSVPTHTVQVQESEEDREMRELTESMGA